MKSSTPMEDVNIRSRHDPPGGNELFKLLFDQLKSSYDDLIQFEFKHGTILIAIIGWLLTSKQTHTLLASSQLLCIVGVIVILSLSAMHAFWVQGYVSKNDDAFKSLVSEFSVEDLYICGKKLRPGIQLTFSVIHAAICILVCVIIWRLHTLPPL